MEQQTYTIREMSERFGLPASTLRYYEEIGLLTDVIHTESKKRIYTQQHINCMTAILCFKRTGLPIAGIQEFFRLENDIPGNIDQMVAILKEHEQNTREKIERMESDLEHIQQKVRYYSAVRDAIKNGSAPSLTAAQAAPTTERSQTAATPCSWAAATSSRTSTQAMGLPANGSMGADKPLARAPSSSSLDTTRRTLPRLAITTPNKKAAGQPAEAAPPQGQSLSPMRQKETPFVSFSPCARESPR